VHQAGQAGWPDGLSPISQVVHLPQVSLIGLMLQENIFEFSHNHVESDRKTW